jgi:hypothetical protein
MTAENPGKRPLREFLCSAQKWLDRRMGVPYIPIVLRCSKKSRSEMSWRAAVCATTSS